MDEIERLGRPYWQCRTCDYSSMNRAYVEAHVVDHEVRPTLDEYLAAQAAPEPTVSARRKTKET